MSRLPPTGTVTLLLADVEESTHLWQMCPEDMATAIAHLDHTVSEGSHCVGSYHESRWGAAGQTVRG